MLLKRATRKDALVDSLVKQGCASRMTEGADGSEFFWFIADLVAAGLLLARTDPVDEWLQAALALSIEIFWRAPLAPRQCSGPGCLNRSIRGITRRVRPLCMSSAPMDG